MYKYKIILYSLISIVLISCIQPNKKEKNSQVQRLEIEKDSLIQAKMNLEKEVNEYFATLSKIEENIDKIKDKQHIISINPLSENTPKDTRIRITEDINYINELINSNQEELNSLREKLKKSSFDLSNVEKNIAQLTKELNKESRKVAHLQKLLYQKDSVINNLDEKVDSLGKNIDSITTKQKESIKKIEKQTEKINTVWYAIGSRKELKKNKIISSEGIFSAKKVLQDDFNKNYFVKIDARNTNSIPLYASKKANILTNHPNSSYTLEKENNTYVLIINDAKAFWSISKYLVIEAE